MDILHEAVPSGIGKPSHQGVQPGVVVDGTAPAGRDGVAAVRDNHSHCRGVLCPERGCSQAEEKKYDQLSFHCDCCVDSSCVLFT